MSSTLSLEPTPVAPVETSSPEITLCELRGVIKSITPSKGPRSRENTFIVTAPKMKKDFTVSCNFFCREGRRPLLRHL